MLADDKVQMFQVRGDLPTDAAPALFSNFLAVSRVATEVQFEFIFLDLNQMANTLSQLKAADVSVAPLVQGKTVAKVVMPAASFIQLKEQLEVIFSALKEALPKVPEVENGLRSSRVG